MAEVKLSESDREELKRELKNNRNNSLVGGRGPIYWDSVVDVFEAFLTYVKERKEKANG